ncbi:polyhydroxyalkanoate synthase [Actimicrobium sp. GrIS 1.19]|uniref:class I poly(R)-hydroxyalkanoic acid synthase n=1 Tax=Actimicrobium sp. GrIS 1.19 TaxID=3071708 RepID=UPI002E030549|nr:polyhydroxyalkanoate synthase [Actimicrobium sp. GrIS 1.19]
MTSPDPLAAIPDWMAQLADPAHWQHFLTPMQNAPLPDGAAIAIDPAALAKMQSEYTEALGKLWQDTMASRSPVLADKRFGAPAWQANGLSAFNAAAYLLNARFLNAMTDAVKASPKVKEKIRFTVQQMTDAMSPANFLVTNPEAQQMLIDTKGESLTRGLANMLADMRKGRISQTDETAFEVGKNVATTEGAVVFENALFQLIQYKALTKTVHERPLLIVPPCINKFYILDLQPDNSLVRYAVAEGHTVFLVSWCNPDRSQGDLTWDDYIEHAALKAIRVVQEISGQKQINALGFCVGGTILSTALALLFARGQKPVASLTLLTSFLDFSDTGIIDVFIDETQVALREQQIGKGGLMEGKDFASTFSSLRPNDLVWNYVKANYLKGEEPAAFDLLYWNSDSTNLPGPMFCWYLRNMYLDNSLRHSGKLQVLGEPVDLSKIAAPTFIYASREDHIVPWHGAYASTALLNPKHPELNQFVLGASGHIAGVINPASKNKRNYWTCEQAALSADDWLAKATEHPGSWWPQWSAFLKKHAGKQIKPPRQYGDAHYQPIEPAPGRYVKVKA